MQVQEHKDLSYFLFGLISVQRLCLISYPCLKCGIHLLLLLSQKNGATKLFWFSLAWITLCWGSRLWDGAALATSSAKECFSPYSAATDPVPLKIVRWEGAQDAFGGLVTWRIFHHQWCRKDRIHRVVFLARNLTCSPSVLLLDSFPVNSNPSQELNWVLSRCFL